MTFPLDDEFRARFARGSAKRSWWSRKNAASWSCICATRCIRSPARPGPHRQDRRARRASVSRHRANSIRIRSRKCSAGCCRAKRVEEQVAARVRFIEDIGARAARDRSPRAPNFCSGCPHNRSTLLLRGPGGRRRHRLPHHGDAAASIPAAAFRSSRTWAAKARRGSAWRRSSSHEHIFQNIGDGTFFHSGSLAVKALVASGLNITYKILYNGHVAMTGGQDASARCRFRS